MPEYVWELPAVRPEPTDTPVSEGAIDHAEAAVNRLALQFRKPKIEAFVRALCGPMNTLEQAFIDLIDQHLNITDAVGETLNLIGKLVGQKQIDVTDTTYRSLVRARIRANKSSGIGDQVLLVSRLVLTDYAAQDDVVAAGEMKLRALNRGRASYALLVDGMDLPWDLADLLMDSFLRKITGTGIRATLYFFPQRDPDLNHHETAFRFSSASDSSVGVGGLGSIADATVGGEMAAAIV